MDPDKALDEIRKLQEDFFENRCMGYNDLRRMLDLLEGLDDWLCAGGFLPKAWEKARGREHR